VTIRNYVIEKSVDMKTWTPLSTVALDGYGRVDIPDTGAAAVPTCYYRAIETIPLIIGVAGEIKSTSLLSETGRRPMRAACAVEGKARSGFRLSRISTLRTRGWVNAGRP
jgi:hypothetical protein